jgi:hypothetical protein
MGVIQLINPDSVHLVLSGAVPGYSFGTIYSREAHQTKLIGGTALTESGR